VGENVQVELLGMKYVGQSGIINLVVGHMIEFEANS
jgi:hypothetical protein